MINKIKTIKHLTELLYDFNYYDRGLIRVIEGRIDWAVKDKLSYSQWIDTYKQYPVIKIEGIELNSEILKTYPNLQIKNIHAFFSQKTGYSFKWHKDDLDVILLVLSGHKTVHLRNNIIDLYKGEKLLIKKGHIHKVFSKRGTWALSIGLQ